jgi:preprotein translocase subunit SecD
MDLDDVENASIGGVGSIDVLIKESSTNKFQQLMRRNNGRQVAFVRGTRILAAPFVLGLRIDAEGRRVVGREHIAGRYGMLSYGHRPGPGFSITMHAGRFSAQEAETLLNVLNQKNATAHQ